MTPNFLILMADQLSAGALRHPQCPTPNFDRLAQQGTSITRAITPNAICSPARASLMTGTLPHTHGVLTVTHTMDADQNVIRPHLPHFAQRLTDQGYHNGYFGKWHVDHTGELSNFGWQVNGSFGSPHAEKARKKLPQNDSELTISKSLSAPGGYPPSLFYGVTPHSWEGRNLGHAVSMASEFLEEAIPNDKPWCCFVSCTEPHDPFVCSEQALQKIPENLPLAETLEDPLTDRPNLYRKVRRAYTELSQEDHLMAARCYYGNVTEIDEAYGTLIDKVQEKAPNTIILLCSDHGELLGAHGLYCKNVGAFEEVYRIPMILAGPGILQNKELPARFGLQDIAPTLCELAGADPIDHPDSRSLVQSLTTGTITEEDKANVSEYFGGRILLSQRVFWKDNWKFVFNGFDYDELYDLEADPHETVNLIDNEAYAEVRTRMIRFMWERAKQTGDHSLVNSRYHAVRGAFPTGPEL